MRAWEAFLEWKLGLASRFVGWPTVFRWPFRLVFGPMLALAKDSVLTVVSFRDGSVRKISFDEIEEVTVEHDNFGFLGGYRLWIEIEAGGRVVLDDSCPGFEWVLASVDDWGVPVKRVET